RRRGRPRGAGRAPPHGRRGARAGFRRRPRLRRVARGRRASDARRAAAPSSGRLRRGGRVTSFLLTPAALLFEGAVRARAGLYRRGLLRSEAASVPVISVGNLVAGGTGKTPMTALIARLLLEAGCRPAIVSRG